MFGREVRWTATAWTVLIIELLMVPLLMGMTFYIRLGRPISFEDRGACGRVEEGVDHQRMANDAI